MDYKKFSRHGLSVEVDEEIAAVSEIFNFLGGSTFPSEGINGLFRLCDESGYYNGDRIPPVSFEETKKGVELAFETPVTRYTAAFEYEGDGLWKRRDRIKNLTKEHKKIYSCLSRFVLSGGNFDILTQEGSWCGENETLIKPVNGNICLSNNGIRTAQDAQPFICVKEKNQGYGLAFHLFPIGQWKINAEKRHNGQLAVLVLNMGLCDDGLALELLPEEEITLPEIIFFRTEPTDNGFGSRKIQKYLLEKKTDAKQTPLLYNTWFLDFEKLEPDLVKKQVYAAAKLGLEYFVIDSGWFGKETDGWYNQCGNWFENEQTAFKGKMKEFADYVRSRGLKFGLWFEIERVSKSSDFYKENPDICFDIDGSNALYNFALPEACDKVFNIIKENIEKYGIEFIKFDYNASLSHDPTGSSFYRYYKGWYGLMDRLRRAFPQTFFECCSSGGQRTDSETLMHYDSLFSSDTVHPLLTARIIDGAMIRIPPRFITKWLALREVSGVARRYYRNEKTDLRLLSGTDGSWDNTIEIPVEYLEAYSVINGLGFTARIDDYSEETTEKLRKIIDFYKKMRPFVEKAVSSPLTPPKKHSDYANDLIWQLSSVDEDTHVIAALHMENYRHGLKIVPQYLDSEADYEVSFIGNFRTNGFDKTYTAKGSELMRDGIVFAFPDIFTGRLAKIKRK